MQLLGLPSKNMTVFVLCILADRGYCADVFVQTLILLRKNVTISLRNKTATLLRILTPLFFQLLVFIVNGGLQNRYRSDPFFRNVPHPARAPIGPMPTCRSSPSAEGCRTFAYSPAPGNEFIPSADASDVAGMTRFATEVCRGCGDAFCKAQKTPGQLTSVLPASSPSSSAGQARCGVCCEFLRVHMVVRGIIRNNPLRASEVIGFKTESDMDDWMLRNPNRVQVCLTCMYYPTERMCILPACITRTECRCVLAVCIVRQNACDLAVCGEVTSFGW